MNEIRLLTFLAISTLAFSHAFGRAGDLDAPSLALPADSESRQSVTDVVCDKQFKFLHGRMLNAGSTLMDAGDAASLNSFLSRLAQCKGAKLTVSFSKDEGAMSWTLSHNGWINADAFHVFVNTAHIPDSAVKISK